MPPSNLSGSDAIAPNSIQAVYGPDVTAIGDSILVDASPYLQQMLPGIDVEATVDRQLDQAPQLVAQLKAQGRLGNRVILELGTNGPFSRTELTSLLKSLGPVQRIVLVNTRVPEPWEPMVNQTLAQVAKTWPHTVLVNWYQDSAHHHRWFYPDGVHLNPIGAKIYARLLLHAVKEPLPKTSLPPSPNAVSSPPAHLPSGKGITAIGDSVMVDASPYLQQMLPGINVEGKIGRQLWQTPLLIAQLKADGTLGNRVILELGTNGSYTAAELTSLLKSLGPVQRIVLVNTRVPEPWESVVNQTLAQVAKTWPHTVLVNWYQDSANHNRWFYPDGVHLNPVGAKIYARLLVNALKEPLSSAHH
jgi:lysophospholipase L1-like esterase